MKFRWTIKELDARTDNEILRSLVAERQSVLNPYAPLAKRLNGIYENLNEKIKKERK